jgi:hypothetical protein
MNELLLAGLLVINQILNAGNAVTAFSLLLYALTFNPRERTARILAALLACVSVTYFAEVMAGTAGLDAEKQVWLRMQWVGISFVPAAYMQFSDALLAATGRPSRGRRRNLINIAYLLSGACLAAVGYTDDLVDGLRMVGGAGHLIAGPYFFAYVLFFLAGAAFTALNFWRAYQRCLTRVSRRRMSYLAFGILAPFLACFPFLTLTDAWAIRLPLLSWSVLVLVNMLVSVQLVLMTYAVAYFGVSFPDRVVKSRLFQWILRGPVVASSVLAVTVVVNRAARLLGAQDSRVVPFAMVATLLLLQFVITLIRPSIERWLFYGQDRRDMARLHRLEERLLTTGDLRQYLESILNAACDLTAAPSAFVAVVGPEGMELEVAVGSQDPLRGTAELSPLLSTDDMVQLEGLGALFRWEHHWLIPLRRPDQEPVLGILGLRLEADDLSLGEAEQQALRLLAERAVVALTDRQLQREVFSAVDRLVPEMEAIQEIRAAARYRGADAFTSPVGQMHFEDDFVNLVRQALGHYWGGPRLTRSPLLGLRVVRDAVDTHDGNAVNALRSIIRAAIERVRPEGERRLTGEWMLYNILEMKFLEGRKVRDVAMRLAMSEADLYRKQKIAIESVAKTIVEMEREALQNGGGPADGK